MTHDVFISFKNSDENGYQTVDSKIAKKLYDFLTKKGLRVFFSNIELEFTGKAQYSKVINKALDSSRFLVVVGSSSENLNSEWVYYEWDSFLNDIRSGIKPNAEVYVLYSGMKVSELPRALRQQQAFNANEKYAFEKLYRFIENALEGIPLETRERLVEEETQTHSKTQETNKPQPVSVPMPMENSKLKPVNINPVNPKPINKKPHTFPKLPKWMIPVIAGLVALVIGAVLMFNRERSIIQNQEYNNIEEEGIISFFPSGTLTIKTTSGEEYKAILNTVSGFPMSIYKDGTEYKLALDAINRAEFTYQNIDHNNKTVTIRTYDENNRETIFIENAVYTSTPFFLLTDKGLRILTLEQVERMTKDENKTPQMPKNTIPMYIRIGETVYKVPLSLLKYSYGELMTGHHAFLGCSPKKYRGLPYYGGDLFRTNSLKYVRICKEVKGFGKTKNSVYANVYFADNRMVSTCLLFDSDCSSSLVIPTTAFGEKYLMITDIDEIFFGSYDVDFASKAAKKAWDGSKIASFTEKGMATVYKNDGTKFVFALNTLVAVGKDGGRTYSYPTTYLKIIREDWFYGRSAENGTYALPLFFSDIKSLKVKNNDKNKLIADYLLFSGETGEKHILDSQLEGLTENGKESINWWDIEKIDIDNNRNVDLSQLKKALIVDKNGYVFETLRPMLYFRYDFSRMYTPDLSNEQTIRFKDGSSLPYEKIKKIEFLPAKQDGEIILYPAKITLRAGSSQELMLDNNCRSLQFLTAIGVFALSLREGVQSIEFID